MLQNLKRKQQGFTIIEVMIVLVVAAVILLIVFLAVPALQRNSRNTQRREDASNLLAASTEAANNAGGTYPTAIATITALVKSGFYQTSNITLNASPSAAVTNATTDQSIVVVTNAKCNGVDATPSTRSVAVLYTIENNTKQCLES